MTDTEMNDTDDKLTLAARGLATAIRPQRDLWPDIAEAIGKPQKSRWTPMLAQAAAVLLLVGASSMVTYVAIKYDAAATAPSVVTVAAPTNLNFERAAFGGDHTLASLYGRAGGSVRSDLERDLQSLSPEARDDVQRNLAVIRQAIDEIAAALEKEPNNVFLQELLLESYGNELALMNRVGTMAQRVTARKDI
jgi:hypothetical protein